MSKRFRKLAAIVLASAMLLQNGAAISADEGQSETQTEAVQTEVPTEKLTEAVQTEAPTEKVTEAAQTEAPTEKVTEAVQTEAPTEKPTEAVQTEAPTEKVTEAAQTEAPTEKVTEAAQTEAPTEKPTEKETEKLTEKPSEKETEKKTEKPTEEETEEQSEKQTERSERKNDGEKFSADELTGKLKQALPYLFAAEQVDAPDELLEGQEIASGSEGIAVTSGLEDFSAELANAKSSSLVRVVNLYADKDGKLDTAQLDDLFSDHVIDVTKQYYVVNVIAYSADQELSFSGYEMQLSGETVEYTEGTERGDILYNFAALDDEGAFSGYEGELTLDSKDRLQGTFLAPEADVSVDADLAGAVYAGSVKVTDSVEELLQIVFAEGREQDSEEQTEGISETPAERMSEETTGAAGEESENTGAEETEEGDMEVIDAGNETIDGNASAVPLEEENPLPTASPTPSAVPSTEPSPSPSTEPSPSPSTEPSPSTSPSIEPTPTGEPANANFSVSVEVMFDGQILRALTDASGGTLPYIALFKKGDLEAPSPSGTPNPATTSVPAGTPVPTGTPAPGSGTGNPSGSPESGEGQGSAPLPVPVQKKQPVFAADADKTELKFEGLPAGEYVLKLTDEQGNILSAEAGEYPVLRCESGSVEKPGVLEFKTDDAAAGSQNYTLPDSRLVLDYGSDSEKYPSQFYYEAAVTVTKRLQDSAGKSKKSSEVFYAGLFADANHEQKLTDTPIMFEMNEKASVSSVPQLLKATASPMNYFVAETDAQGNVITEGTGEEQGRLHYAIMLQGSGTDQTGKIEVTASSPKATATITNRLNTASVRVGVMHGDKYIKDVTLVVKNRNGKIVSVVDQKKTFQSEKGYRRLTDVPPDGEYYLSEVNAPSGYAPAADVPFTVEEGKVTTVLIENEPLKTTDYKLTVSAQVFSGQYQLYAQDDQNDDYLGNRTFYVALFKDATHLIKVSNVEKIVMSRLSGSVEFKNLNPNETYFLAETDEYGEVISASAGLQIRYANDGMVPMDAKEKTTVVQNIYNRRPAGYRYTGTVTITKRVTDASGAAQKTTDTFYVGMFRNAECSGTPAATISLNLNDATSVSVRRRILLSGENSATYYFAELDASGNKVDGSDTFAYNVTIDQPSVTVARGEDKAVVITNQAKSSKVTLYLTKRVYQGTSLYPVTDTFYMGLFQDPQFSKLYTNPIPLSLKNQSELTLKITLNLGTKDKAVIYVAETDKNGRVIRNESQFGYNIRAVNSTAVFTQQTREIQTIFLNSVYGSATDDDWKEIMSDENNIPSYGGSDGWFGGNGEIDPNADTTAVRTGDETPIGLYIGLLAAAVIVLILLLILRMRGKKRK